MTPLLRLAFFDDDWNDSNQSSWGWKGIKWGLNLLKKGCSWTIGDGCKAKIHHPWVRGKPPNCFFLSNNSAAGHVRDLTNDDDTWNQEKLEAMFAIDTIAEINSIYPLEKGNCDTISWNFDKKNGEYSTKVVILIMPAEKSGLLHRLIFQVALAKIKLFSKLWNRCLMLLSGRPGYI